MDKTRRWILDGATVIIAIAGAILAVRVAWERIVLEPGPGQPRVDRVIDDWEQYSEEGRWLGPKGASLVILEFGDYECPFCKAFHETVREIRMSYPSEVAVVYRHFPLPQHPNAYFAARLAECAADQGAFAAVHDRLYRTDDLAAIDPSTLASEVGLPDIHSFEACADEEVPVPSIEADIEAAEALQISGTPGIIYDGTYLARTPTLQQLEEMIATDLPTVRND